MKEFATLGPASITWRHAPATETLFAGAALDRLPNAVLVVAAPRRITFANRAAMALLAQKDGLRLRGHAGHARLIFDDNEDERRFEALDASVATRRLTARSGVGLRIARPSSKPDYVLQICPLERFNGYDARAAVFITDPCEHHRLDAQLLLAVYAITTAELRLAEELLGDLPLVEIAAKLGIKESTARSQLLSLFRKTRTSRQAQLIKLLMALRLPP